MTTITLWTRWIELLEYQRDGYSWRGAVLLIGLSFGLLLRLGALTLEVL